MATGTDIYTIELVDRVSSRAVRASMSVSRLTNSLDRVGRSGALAQLALNSAASAIGNIAARGFGRAMNAVGDLGRSLVDTIGLASRSKFALAAMYGSAEAGAKAQQRAGDIARKYGLDVENVLDTLGRFRGAGFSERQSEQLLSLGADLRALNVPEEAMNRFFVALGQIKTKGKLAAEEMNQLAEAGGAAFSREKVFAELQARLGKTREEIVKLQETGKISGDLGISAVLAGIAKTTGKKAFGELGEEFANNTTSGIAGRLKENFKVDLLDAAKAAEPALVAGLQSVLRGALGADGKTLQDALTNALVQVGKGLQDLGPKIPAFIASLEKLAVVLGRLVPLLENVFAPAANKYQSSLPGASLGLDNTSGLGKFLATKPGALLDIVGDFWGNFFKPGQMVNGTGGAPTAAADFGGPLNDLAFSAATESFDGTIDAADRAALAAPSSGIRTQVVEAAAAVAAGTPGAGKKVDVGSVNVNINLSGSGDPAQAADNVRGWFETDFGATLERQLEGTGD